MNLPIYRAKKIGSDEYIIGHYTEKVKEYPGKHYIHFNNGYTETYERIDPKTLAIHFKDMVDSEGNKIFASLSKDGTGGDVVDFEHIRYLEDDEPSYMIKGLCIFIDSSFFVEDIDNKFDRVFYDEMGCNFRNEELRVIGIQE